MTLKLKLNWITIWLHKEVYTSEEGYFPSFIFIFGWLTKINLFLETYGQFFFWHSNYELNQSIYENRLWWPSSLSLHLSNSSRDIGLGPRFESHSRLVFIWYHNGPTIILPKEYGIDHSESKMTCRYSNSRVLGDTCRLKI